jgi:hypothetical protein
MKKDGIVCVLIVSSGDYNGYTFNDAILRCPPEESFDDHLRVKVGYSGDLKWIIGEKVIVKRLLETLVYGTVLSIVPRTSSTLAIRREVEP